MMHRQRIVIASTILAAAAVAAPAAADWIVLADGGKVETSGPWEVRGGLVVFTSTSGTLSSLRTSEVDLAASERATEEARRPAAPAAPAPRPKAKVVLTEKDLPPVPQPLEGEAEAAAADPAAAANARAPIADDARLAVAGWDVTTPDEFDGTIVTGRLRNVSGRLLTRVALDVTVYSASGTQLGRTAADIDPGPVAPDRIVDFEARFPGLYDVTTARFDARGVGFLEGGAESEGEGEAGAAEAPESDSEPEPIVPEAR